MKYLLLIVLLSSPVFAQTITDVKSGAYKLRHAGVIQAETYGNQRDAKAAAIKLSNECHIRTNGGLCTVAVMQPDLTVTTRTLSSSSSSSRSSSASSSSIAPRVAELSWTAPTERVNGEALNPDSELSGFNLKLNGSVVFVPYIAPVMSYTIYDYSSDKTYAIAAVDKSDTSSAYVDFFR